MLRPSPVKSATPATALIEVVPPRVPGPVVRVSPTLAVESVPDVTVFPNWSSIVTTGCCENATPSTVLAEGCVVNTIWLAAANVIAKAGLVVAVLVPANIVAVAVSALSIPTKLMLRPLPVKSATPATAGIEVVPPRVPVPVVSVSATLSSSPRPWSLYCQTDPQSPPPAVAQMPLPPPCLARAVS